MIKARDYNSINWHEIFIEDSSSYTGLRWNINRSNRIKTGYIAGGLTIDKKYNSKYFKVKFKETLWMIHRILWVIHNGSIDADLDIDHIDGNGLNNSSSNLRLVSRAVNSRNQKMRRNNSTGVMGVGFVVNNGGDTYVRARWRGLCNKQKEKYFPCKELGLLPAFTMACAWREKVIKELNECGAGYSERHGEV